MPWRHRPQPSRTPRPDSHGGAIRKALRRAWRRFRSNRLGYVSLILFAILFGVSLLAEVVSNDKPLIARYEGQWYLPLFQTLPESTFGDFPTPTDYLDPLIRDNLAKPNWSRYPLNPYHHHADQLLLQGTESRPAER